MLKKIGPALLALIILAVFLARSERPGPVPSGPDECVRAMFAAAREGRVADYLDSFCDPLRASLADNARTMGSAKFREYLQSVTDPVMGMAFSDVVERNPEEAALRCELVFKDRNEVQRFLLRKLSGRWRIADMTPAERIKPPVPYGTKVFE